MLNLAYSRALFTWFNQKLDCKTNHAPLSSKHNCFILWSALSLMASDLEKKELITSSEPN